MSEFKEVKVKKGISKGQAVPDLSKNLCDADGNHYTWLKYTNDASSSIITTS